MTELEQRLFDAASKTASLDELKQLAQENQIFLSDEELKVAFAKTHQEEGELDDDELDNVSGGCNLFDFFKKTSNSKIDVDVSLGMQTYCEHCGTYRNFRMVTENGKARYQCAICGWHK